MKRHFTIASRIAFLLILILTGASLDVSCRWYWCGGRASRKVIGGSAAFSRVSTVLRIIRTGTITLDQCHLRKRTEVRATCSSALFSFNRLVLGSLRDTQSNPQTANKHNETAGAPTPAAVIPSSRTRGGNKYAALPVTRAARQSHLMA